MNDKPNRKIMEVLDETIPSVKTDPKTGLTVRALSQSNAIRDEKDRSLSEKPLRSLFYRVELLVVMIAFGILAYLLIDSIASFVANYGRSLGQ